jgi:hypothetical protein
MKAIADCLTQSVISYPLVQLRTLFQKFLGLSQGFFNEEMNSLQILDSEPAFDCSYPIGNPFSISWDQDPSFNQISFAGAESFSGMLGMSDTELFMPYESL